MKALRLAVIFIVSDPERCQVAGLVGNVVLRAASVVNLDVESHWLAVLCFCLTPLPSPAFNVTIRSDRRGTCKGTHLVYACVGYCESSAFPSRYSVLVASNFTHNITSASRCCTISKDGKVRGGWRQRSMRMLLDNGLHFFIFSNCFHAVCLFSGQSSPGLPSK